MLTSLNLTLTSIIVCFVHHRALVAAAGSQGIPKLSSKVPVVCISKACSTTTTAATTRNSVPLHHLASDTVLEISGGGAFGKRVTTFGSEHDSDDELLHFAEESDIVIEVRGGSMTGTVNVSNPQPLRISTYRKGIRQLRNSERRARRRQKRLERMEKRKQRQEAKKTHQLYASKLKVSFCLSEDGKRMTVE